MPNNQPKQQRPPRPNRRRIRTQNGNKNLQKTSLAKVQSNLTKSPVDKRKLRNLKSSLYDMMYAKCRLDPFNSMGSTGIPDGLSARKIVIDHRSFTNINFTGSGTSFDIVILPTLPFQAVFRTPTPANVTLDGNIGSAGTINNTFVPINVPPEYMVNALNSPSNLTYGDNPFLSNQARIVTVGFKLTYTGPPVNASGTLLGSSVALDWTSGSTNRLAAPTTGSWAAATDSTYSNANTLDIDVTLNNNAVPESVFVRTDQGAKGVLKTLQPVSTVKPWIGESYLPLNAATGRTFVGIGRNSAGASIYPNICFFDNRFQSIMLSGSNMASGTGLLLEVITCVEYYPEPGSTFARLAKASPKTEPLTLRATEQVLAASPAIQPLGEPSTFQKFVRLVATTAKSASGFLGPYAPIAGAVGNMAEAIGNLSL